MGNMNVVHGNMAWCKVLNDDHTYKGHRACTEDEYDEYLARWKEAMGIDDLYQAQLVAKGIEVYPVFLKKY